MREFPLRPFFHCNYQQPWALFLVSDWNSHSSYINCFVFLKCDWMMRKKFHILKCCYYNSSAPSKLSNLKKGNDDWWCFWVYVYSFDCWLSFLFDDVIARQNIYLSAARVCLFNLGKTTIQSRHPLTLSDLSILHQKGWRAQSKFHINQSLNIHVRDCSSSTTWNGRRA